MPARRDINFVAVPKMVRMVWVVRMVMSAKASMALMTSMTLMALMATMVLMASSVSDVHAEVFADTFVDTFADGLDGLTDRWQTIEVGSGSVSVEHTPDQPSALVVALPEGTDKRAAAVLIDPLQPAPDQPVRVSFNMRQGVEPGGYGQGMRYGRPGYAVEFGRYGRRNFDAKASRIFLGDQDVAIDARADAWLHYDMSIGLTQQTLAVYHVDGEGQRIGQPIAQLQANQTLSRFENNLVIINNSPFHNDAFGQSRGVVKIDSFRMIGEHPMTQAITQTHTLETQGASYTIDLNTGRLVSGEYASQPILEASADEYRLILRDREVLSWELDDRVISVDQTSDSSCTMTATNAALPGIELQKKYHLDHGQLVKTLTLVATQTLDGFLYVRTATNPAPRLIQGGYYHTIKGWEVDTLRDTATVLLETKIGHPHADTGNQILALVNPTLGVTLGQFQYRVDGQYVWPRHYIHEDSTTYSPQGWRFPAIAFHPEAGVSHTVETRLIALDGDQVDFHRRYRAMDEVATRLAIESPAWVRKTKFDAVCWGQDPVEFSQLTQGALDQSRYTDDEYAFVNMWGWATWGYQPTEPDEQVRIRGETELIAYKPTQWLVDSIAHIHANLPGCKIGLYHFPWALAPQSPYGQENLNQMAYARDGEFLPKIEPGWTAAYRALLAGQGVEGMLEAFKREIDRYNVDFFYLDGGVASQSRPDWRTMTAEQGHDWMRLWKGVHDIAREAGPEKAVYQNHFVQMFGDAGYYEDGAFAKTYKHNWRIIGDGMQMAKLYQRPGGYLSVLYRGGGGHAEPHYTNMVLATGLRPAAAADPHVIPNWPHWFGYLSYVNAAYELRDTVWVDAVVEPRWWADQEKQTDLQVVTLRQGNALLVNRVNHDASPREHRVVIDLDAAGLDSGRPIYLWRQDLTPADYQDAELAVAPTEPVDLEQVVTATPIARLDNPSRVFERSDLLHSASMSSLVLTCEPVMVTSVGVRATQFALPDMLDVHATGVVYDDRVMVKVDTPDHPAGVSVWLPASFGQSPIVDGKGNAVTVETLGDIRFAKLALPAGKHVIVLKPRS